MIDRTLQQAITQQLVPIYEPLFADGSYGYSPNRSAKDAILKVKEYAEQGYTFAVVPVSYTHLTANIPGIVIFPVFLVLASITWPLCLLALFVLTIKELDNEQNNYDQRDL